MFKIIRPFVGSARCFSTSGALNVSGEKIGFIGLGNMGGYMAMNLAKKGHPLVVYDVKKESIETIKKEAGPDVSVADSPADVAAAASVVVTVLPSTQNVKEVYLGDKGILKTAKKGTLMVDSTTLDPSMCKVVAQAALAKETHYIDAPISGGVLAARDGNLTFMVGGPEQAVEQARPVLQKMGKNVFHCGHEVGSGEAVKLCNNVLLAISMFGVSEALNLGMRLGLDPKVMTKVMAVSTGRCWSLDTYNPVPGVIDGVPSSRDYDGGFQSVLMAKDLGLAQDVASSLKIPMPFGSQALNLYRIMCNQGLAHKDFSSAFKFLQELEK